MKLELTNRLLNFISKYGLEATYNFDKEELRPLAVKVISVMIKNGIKKDLTFDELYGNVLAWIYAKDSPLIFKGGNKI